MGEIIAGAAVEPHMCAVLPGDDPKPVVLHLMQPLGPEGNLSVLVGRHGAMNPVGRVRCNIAPIAKAYSGASQPFLLRNSRFWISSGCLGLLL
jgi:hypothetical protein